MIHRYLVLDYETYSEADLRKLGAYEYANHPSTRILCVAWRLGNFAELNNNTTETKLWSPLKSAPYGELKRALLDPSITIVAHNAFFEQVITRFVLSKLINEPYLKKIPHERWICTASMARALAFPAKLENACQALRLPVQKDMEGHRLMLKLSKPKKPSKKDPSTRHKNKADYERLFKYCTVDIDAEVALFTSIPMLSKSEHETWLLDQKMNMRGFKADRPLVDKILGWIDEELNHLTVKTRTLTHGEIQSTNQRAAMLKWLQGQGVYLPNLQKKTVEDALKSGVADELARELLEVRADASKTSTAKYEAFEARSRSDGRVRENQVYHTASTGRFGGAGVQIHNLPRGTIGDTDQAAEILSDPDTDLELIRLLYGKPLDVFSSCLRSVIQPSPGMELVGGDFAGIELRVLFWIAKHEDGLQAFIDGRDLYRELATVIYSKKLADVTKPEREVAKRAVLGSGFGMGKDKFFETCKAFGQEISLELAAEAVAAYRETHEKIPALWKNLELAAIAAVKNPTKSYKVNRVTWFMEGRFLYCELPSGRRLAYYGPKIEYKETPWGEKRPTLYHWDINPKTKKWVYTHTYGGKLTENVVQAIARDKMVDSMKRAENREMRLLLTVHDELLTENEIGKVSVEEFESMMAENESWSAGLPIKVEGFKGMRYRK